MLEERNRENRSTIGAQESVLFSFDVEITVGDTVIDQTFQIFNTRKCRATAIPVHVGSVIRLQILNHIETAVPNKGKQGAERRDLMIPDMRAILDDDVE